MKNNSTVLGGFILTVILLSSCTSKENRNIPQDTQKPVVIISDEQKSEKDIAVASNEKTSEIIAPKSNSSGTEIKEIFVGSEKRGSYNPFRTGPIEPSINEWLANGPYDGPYDGLNDYTYADPHSYWKDNLDSHTSIKPGAVIVFTFEGKNASVQLGGSGTVKMLVYDNNKVNKTIIVQGEKQYFPLDSTKPAMDANGHNRSYVHLIFSKGVDLYSFKVE